MIMTRCQDMAIDLLARGDTAVLLDETKQRSRIIVEGATTLRDSV